MEMHTKFIAASKGFFDAYENLKVKLNKNPKENGLLIFPISINLAFANELALKALFMKSNYDKKSSGHDLHKLFSKQTKDISLKVKTQMNNAYKYDENKFENLLNKNREVFKDWRYLEGGDKHVDLIFLEHLWNVTTVIYKNALNGNINIADN